MRRRGLGDLFLWVSIAERQELSSKGREASVGVTWG